MRSSIVLLVALIACRVHAITISPGNAGGAMDQVRFTNAPDATGTHLNGWFNSDNSIVVNLSSSSSLEVQNGAVSLGGLNNTNFQDLTFSLADGGTFHSAVLNPDATTAGSISFNVSYLGISPSNFIITQSFSLNAHGQNFYTIQAGAGEVITSVTFNSADSAFEDSGHIRIGLSAAVPDGGYTFALLGFSLLLLGVAGVYSGRKVS
jgi:hypothetical protein